MEKVPPQKKRSAQRHKYDLIDRGCCCGFSSEEEKLEIMQKETRGKRKGEEKELAVKGEDGK